MLSKAGKYQQLIQDKIKRIMLFPDMDNEENKSTVVLQCKIKLPSLYSFRSSQQIENNKQITHQITNQSSKQYPIASQNQWPHPCIGLVLCEHHQNNQTFYVYGMGTLIHNNIVLTSAQNVYCRRLNKQYTNIRFIVGVSGDKCSGIYDVMRVHYPKQYTMQKNENYNFAVLQLYVDFSDMCGYVGWKTINNRTEVEKYIEYGYISDNQEGSFKLRQITKNKNSQQDQACSGSAVLVKENENEYSIIGIHNSSIQEGYIILSEKIRNMINQWTHLTTIDLTNKNVDTQGCKYMSQVNWTLLTMINLGYNNIDPQGCKYLNQANWTHMRQIYLQSNNIGGQGCKYLIQSNWPHLTTLNLYMNNIGAQGCKYLSQANWPHLTRIDLNWNNIKAQGCQYLSQSNWIHLTRINLTISNIGAEGCKYLSQANWAHLTTIYLGRNNIGAQGCKYLSQANWTQLRQIYLQSNNIDAQGCKYLIQSNWTHLREIDLYNNDIKCIIYRIQFLSSYPNTKIKI